MEVSLDINDENVIKSMNMEQFKATVKRKVREAAFRYLNELNANHSKMKNLEYKKLELSKYLNSPLFDHQSAKLLLALRTRTVNGIKADFKSMYADVNCPFGCNHTDTIPNILTCPAIQTQVQTSDMALGGVNYEDIFSNDTVIQKQVTELYRKYLEIRETLRNSSPAAITTGPMH